MTFSEKGPLFKPLDLAAAALFLLVLFLGVLSLYRGGGELLYARIEGSGKTWLFPLDEDRELLVEGPLGETLVSLEEGTLRIEESPCPDKHCVRKGPLTRGGEWTACLPNRVMVRIVGQDQPEEVPDALSY